ncbi:MAG TPA: hypothetical protein VKE74_08195 [Gemmataceae bacterium]|nr:hypothetical protein [Gemmataceae bacterium]
MTRRSTLIVALGFALAGPLVLAAAQDRKPPPDPANPVKGATVEIYGTNGNLDLAGEMSTRAIVNDKDWEALARLWDVRNPPKVDFNKEFLVVVTSRSSKLVVQTKLDDKGDLDVRGLENGDVQGGFRYGIKSVSREGIKTVNGRPLPKE